MGECTDTGEPFLLVMPCQAAAGLVWKDLRAILPNGSELYEGYGAQVRCEIIRMRSS